MTPSANDWRELYPFPSHWLTIDGHRYHYLDEGTGPALLLVHGNPTWSFYWRDVVKALRGRYRVIVPDHLGCGLSDKPPVSQYPYHLADRIRDLRCLVDTLDLRDVSLIAHDWGGAVGMGAAVADPSRYARIALMNTAAFRSKRCPWQIQVCRSPVGQFLIQGLNLFVHAALRMTVERPERMTPAVCAGYKAPYDSWANRVGVYRFVRDIPMTPAHPTYATLQAIEAGLPQFADHPLCLIWGMRDFCFTPEFLERFIEYYPKAEVHRIEDAGHYVVEDALERVVPILERFLERPAPTSPAKPA